MWNVEIGRKYRDNNREKERVRCLMVKRRSGFAKIRDPHKEKARHAVRNAVASGKIIKPASCESCGDTVPLHGHHRDYAEPLDVRWLCSPCHGREHRAALATPAPEQPSAEKAGE